MARCPFAEWQPVSGPSGSHLGGPFKIVHHTTEGSSVAGAMEAYRRKRCDPHFTVDAAGVHQHVDTSMGARALANHSGGVQTNRDSAVQIELVGFAHLPKDPRALTHLARLCRWIEATHGVPRTWPAGPPRKARNGKDPGGHNRDPATWDRQSGHYGHCHVPENNHWDPGYTAEELAFVMDATFDAQGRLIAPPGAPARPTRRAAKAPAKAATRRVSTAATAAAKSTMPDHGDVPVGASAYVRDLALSTDTLALAPARAKGGRAKAARATRAGSAAPKAEAVVDVGALLSFVDGVDAQERDDVLFSVQLAQRGASGAFDRFTQTQAWYQKYVEILENLGWATEQFAFSQFDQAEGELRMDQAALKVIGAIATGGQLAVLQASLGALSKLAESDGAIRLFDFHSSLEGSGNFQLGAVQKSANGALAMATGAFYFRSVDERKRFLFWKWGAQKVHFWTAAQRMTLNTAFYARRRDEVVARLEADAPKYIADLELGAR